MTTHFSNLSNEDLLSNLHTLVGQGHVQLARLLAYLGEVEERRLDLESACSSLYDYCVHRLSMSEDEACRRVAAARLARRFPIALDMIEHGELHLTGLLLLRDHLTEENHEELLRAASGKTKSQAREVIAARFPRPDMPSLIQTLPMLPSRSKGSALPARPERTPKPARVEPLAPERYGVQFTASAELKQKIERAGNLMRHQNPKGDLSLVVERAIDLLIAELEKQRLGKTKQPRTNTPRWSTRRGYVPRAVRREVFERDGEQCTFVDEVGRRCESRAFLELDHKNPRALGGSDDAKNLSVKCRRHNGLMAERDFGRAHVERRKAERRSFDPRQRGQLSETALRALNGLGFKERDARRALGIVSERWEGTGPPIEILLREALAVLT